MPISQAAVSMLVMPRPAQMSVTRPSRPKPRTSRTTITDPIIAAAVALGPSFVIAESMSEKTNADPPITTSGPRWSPRTTSAKCFSACTRQVSTPHPVLASTKRPREPSFSV